MNKKVLLCHSSFVIRHSSIARHSSFVINAIKTLVLMLLIVSCSTSTSPEVLLGGGGEAYPELRTNAKSLKNFRDMRFGMFVHWGPVALKGTEIGWSRGREIPIEVYDNLYKDFNPTEFDADEWISIAKEAGMKYFVITSKHHDGFSLFHSKHTDYDIENSPIKRDLMKEMQLACEKHGVMFGTYHSVLDWKHPHYTTRYHDPRPLEESDMSIYKDFLFNQVEELIVDYNTNLLWFDGQWEASWTHEMGMELYKFCRDLNDDLLINNRVDKGFKSMAGMTDSIAKYAGDYGTPEQRIGSFNNQFPWESCITICKQWAWKPDDVMKSPKECISTLIKTVGGDGNLLLNVGPMPDGRIEPRQVEVLKEIGRWLDIYGEAIYGTRGGPFLPTDDWASTNKGKKIYLHIMNPEVRILELPLPEGLVIRKAKLIGGGKIDVEVERKIKISLPDVLPSDYANVIELTTNGEFSAMDNIIAN